MEKWRSRVPWTKPVSSGTWKAEKNWPSFLLHLVLRLLHYFLGGIFGGNKSGETFILNAHRELLYPGIGIITARQIWDFEFNHYQPISADCPFCGNRFSPPDSVLDTIENITKNASLLPEQSPCLELPKRFGRSRDYFRSVHNAEKI